MSDAAADSDRTPPPDKPVGWGARLSSRLRQTSLRVRLIVLMILAMAPAGVLSIAEAISKYEESRDLMRNSLLQSVRITAAEQRTTLDEAKPLLLRLAAVEDVKRARQPGCDEALNEALAEFWQSSNVAVTDTNGVLVCSARLFFRGTSVRERAWFQEVLKGTEFVVSNPLTSSLTDDLIIVAAMPLRDDNEVLTGTLFVSIDMRWLKRLGRLTGAADLDIIEVVDAEGRPFVSFESNDENPAMLPPAEDVPPMVGGQARIFEAQGLDGVPRVYAVAPLVEDRIFAILGHSAERVYSLAKSQLFVQLATPVSIWLAAILALWLGLERVVIRWITYMRGISSAYGRGQYSVRPEGLSRASGEFRELGEAFSQMADAVEQRNRLLEDALEQKGMLIREVHHRVKNNLQVITSLFNLQTRKISDERTRAVFNEAQGRLNALALIHQGLYQAESLQFVDIRGLLHDLCTSLLSSANAGGADVQLAIDAPSMFVTAEKAVPLALLTTEAVSNSLKHAFHGRRHGRIEVVLTVRTDGSAALVIKDDGIGRRRARKGKPEETGIGLSLIQAFAQQLGGKAAFSNNDGTVVTVDVPQLREEDVSALSEVPAK